MKTLVEFIESDRRNGWMWCDRELVEIYFRKAFRIIDNQIVENILDVANITVKYNYRGQGVFTSALQDIERIAKEKGFQGIFIESVLEPRLIGFLTKQGYRQIPAQYDVNFYKEMK